MNAARWDVEHARRYGNEIGLILGADSWSNADLHDQACRLARALVEFGVEPGARVAIVLPNSRELYVACSAAMMAGGVVVVLPSASEPELASMFAHCEPSVILAPAPLPAAGMWEGSRVRIVTSNAAPAPASEVCFDDLIRHSSRLQNPIERSAADPAQLCFTSGATGRPKAVVYTHGGIDLFWRARAAATGNLDVRRVVLVGIPPTAFGSRFIGMRAIANYQYVLLSPFDPFRALDAIERYGVNELPLVPTMAEQLAACALERRGDISSLRAINIAGAHVSSSLIEKLKARFGGERLSVLVHYGMTETGGGFASTASGGDGSVGRVTPGTVVRIVDREGLDLPFGESGEVVVRAPFAAAGYWRDPEQTAAVFRDGFVHTGDLGSLSPEGDLSILGRIKDIIIQGGLNVLPNEVASVIATVGGVQECAVIGLPNDLLGEEVVACIVRTAGAMLTEQQVRAHCRDRLDPRKHPVSVVFCDELPRTSNAKVSAALLRRQLLEARRRSVPEVPTTAATRPLRLHEIKQCVHGELDAILCEIPRGPQPEAKARRTSTFGELGLGSIDAVRLTHRLNTVFNMELSPTILYSSPTVESLSIAIMSARGLTDQPPRVASSLSTSKDVAIAITGVGCRLPGGASSPDAYWDLLWAGSDTALAPPAVRRASYKADAVASFLDNADAFDAAFFGLEPVAAELDPRHRMVLEVAWEALEDAGCNPLALDRDRTGIFLGIYGDRYPSANRLAAASSMAVSFLCQFLDVRGPVVSVDTTCSSSLVAIHNAVQSLRSGECDIAIAGGVSLLAPEVLEDPFGVVSPDGRTRAFDSLANGFGAGEGCVLLVLRRLPEALQSRDRVLGTLLGTAINHDGRSSTLTAPNPRAQERVIALALQRSQLTPDSVQCVEAHGTGTILGDPIEVEALGRIFGGRTRAPLAIGSVKTNIGHLEAAAGAAGVAKMALAISRRRLPASLHCSIPNPHIPWDRIPIVIQSRPGEWPSPDQPLIAGVSSFGMSGTNAHVIVSECRPVDEPGYAAADALAASERTWLLPLSAASSAALRTLATRWADSIERSEGDFTCRDLAYTASCRRAHLGHRVALAGSTRADWVTALRKVAGSDDEAIPHAACEPHRDLVMVFSGQGPQWWGMGRELFRSQPVFRKSLERCAALIDARMPMNLLDELQRDQEHSRLADTQIAQPALFSLQVSLVELWRSWGVEPTAVLGHSLGEVAAAFVAGALTLEQAANLVCERARASRGASREGAMVAVALTAEEAERVCGDEGSGISVAAHNGPRSSVLAGDAIAIARAVESLRARGVGCTLLRGQYAFHSSHMDVPARDLTGALASWDPVSTRCQLMSCLTGDEADALDASYWGRQLREPVRFFEASQLLLKQGRRIFLEVGPHPVLTSPLLATAESMGIAAEVTVATSLERGRDELGSMLEALSALHCSGFEVDWSRRYDVRGRMVRLPGIVWQHRSYWHAAGSVAAATEVVPSVEEQGPALETRLLRWLAEAAQLPMGAIREDATLDSLGLDSLAIIRLRSKAATAVGGRGLVPAWRAHTTVAQMCRLLGPTLPESPLVWLKRPGSEPAIVWLHPIGGGVSCYREIVAQMPFTSVAIEAPGLNGSQSAARTVAGIARSYLRGLEEEEGLRPRVLAGWSFGGVLAYEMAYQLSRAGRPIDLVVLIDSYLPGGQLGQSLLELFVRDLSASRGEADPRLATWLAARSREAAPVSSSELITQARHFGLEWDISAEYLERMFQVFTGHCDALGRYRAPRYDGPVLSLRASSAVGDPDVPWRAAATRMRVYEVEGDHHSILRPPGCNELARQVHNALAALLPESAVHARRSSSRAS
jgi:acyl transferase domain-containing protein/acyl-CoA synthetase (AMP-forming)/AMP-acid ligase II/thioesterase domain-containing protein